MRVALGFAITLLVVLHALHWYPSADGRLFLISQLENVLYDMRIAILDIDERLEGRTRTYSVGILVGEATRSRVEDVVFREIDRIRVKGKEEAIVIYEPLERGSAELESWGEALRAYRARQWDAAEVVLRRLQQADPACGLFGVYLRKVHDMRRNSPPSDWDGITRFDEK